VFINSTSTVEISAIVTQSELAEVATAGTALGFAVHLEPAPPGSVEPSTTAFLTRSNEVDGMFDLASLVFLYALACDRSARQIADELLERLRAMGRDPERRAADMSPLGGA
jgi:hypothetical protein